MGEIGVTPSHGFPAWVIRKVTRSPYAHAFIATGNGDEIIEAEPNGARIGHASEYRTVVWLRGLTDGLNGAQRVLIVAWARRHLGTPYSWIDDAMIGFADLFHWAPRWMRPRLASDSTLMCSQLCVAAVEAGGRDLFPNSPDGAVSPGDLARANEALTKGAKP
jgi:uncharacterized protein YycO